MGTASTNIAAARTGRNSIGVEIDPEYFAQAHRRLTHAAGALFAKATVSTVDSAAVCA
jgi:DNA modification methylase